MKVLTIVNHGTMNSTDTETSEGKVLVISQIKSLLFESANSRLNQGAGTQKLRHEGVYSPTSGGTLRGLGVEENVRRSVRWIKERKTDLKQEIMVNLVGHSRGSITCYKIARALGDDVELSDVRVNVFAIDPVPGNTGNFFSQNGANYEDIVLGGNVWEGNSFLMLAESEHRLIFRPYVDALYGLGFPNHEFDTIPGTHGGINMLGGYEAEAAKLVLSRALAFLRANGSELTDTASHFEMDDAKRLGAYAKLMAKVKTYEAHATTTNPFSKRGLENLYTGGVQVDRRRIVNIKGSNKKVFELNDDTSGPADSVAQNRRRFDALRQKFDFRGERKNFHGLKMDKAVKKMAGSNGAGPAHAARAHRFYCNYDHETIFSDRYPKLAVQINKLETAETRGPAETGSMVSALDADTALAEYTAMTVPERSYLKTFLKARGIKQLLILADA